MVEENAGQGGKRFIVQIVRTQSYLLEIDFPENEGSMEEAIDSAKEMVFLNMIDDSGWEYINDYDYYIVQQYSEDNSF